MNNKLAMIIAAVAVRIRKITPNLNWGSASSALLNTSSPTRTLTVPPENPGSVRITLTSMDDQATGSLSYNIGAGFVLLGSTPGTSNDVTVSNGTGVTFRFTSTIGGGLSCAVSVTDLGAYGDNIGNSILTRV